MKTVFTRSQQALNKIQSQIKEKLENIQFLDVQCLRLDCQIQELRQGYLQQVKYEYVSDQYQLVNIEDIGKLEEQLKQLAQKKVLIAEQIQQIVAKCSLQIQRQMFQTVQEFTYGSVNLKEDIKMQHLAEFGMTKNKGRQQKIISSQIKAIVKEYYDEKETQHTTFHAPQAYCVCKPNPKNTFSGSMIECQNPSCKVGWYHFQCVGIKIDNVPNHWICQLCESSMKNVKKVTFEKENQKIQLEMNNQGKANIQEVSSKRKRGRPRKFQPINES